MLIYRASRAVVDARRQCKASSPHVGVRSAQSCSRCTTCLRSVLPWCWCTERAELQSMHNFTANRLPLMLIYRPSRAVVGAQLRYNVYWCTERAELQSMHNFTAKCLPLMLMYRASRAAVDAQRHYKASPLMWMYRTSRTAVGAQLHCTYVDVQSEQSCSRCTTSLPSVLPWCWFTERVEL